MGRPSLRRERKLWAEGCRLVAGVDEAGRGPLAGPVLAAAVILTPERARLPGVTDSKLLTAAEREAAAVVVQRKALAWAVAAASVREIDRLNIRRATALAMRRALTRLRVPPEHVLLDGTPLHELGRDHEAMVDGDARSLSIAAASILAKVVRDRLMQRLALRYPQFAWESNKGYGTREHMAALDQVGPTPHHRRSFAPVVTLSFW